MTVKVNPWLKDSMKLHTMKALGFQIEYDRDSKIVYVVHVPLRLTEWCRWLDAVNMHATDFFPFITIMDGENEYVLVNVVADSMDPSSMGLPGGQTAKVKFKCYDLHETSKEGPYAYPTDPSSLHMWGDL